jgi:hypothetical protein
MPAKNDEDYPAMAKDLELLFNKHQDNGLIRINYDTKVFVGYWV